MTINSNENQKKPFQVLNKFLQHLNKRFHVQNAYSAYFLCRPVGLRVIFLLIGRLGTLALAWDDAQFN